MLSSVANCSEEISAIRMGVGRFYRVTKATSKEFIGGLAVRIDDNTLCFWTNAGRRNFINAPLSFCEQMRFMETDFVI